MSKPRFAGLSARLPEPPASKPTAVPEMEAVEPEPQATAPSSQRTKGREGKRAIAGYFSDDLSRQLRTLAASEGTTVQALMGEAFDLLMRARGKHPFNER